MLFQTMIVHNVDIGIIGTFYTILYKARVWSNKIKASYNFSLNLIWSGETTNAFDKLLNIGLIPELFIRAVKTFLIVLSY